MCSKDNSVVWFQLSRNNTKNAAEDANDAHKEDAEATVAHGEDDNDHAMANFTELHPCSILSIFEYLIALYLLSHLILKIHLQRKYHYLYLANDGPEAKRTLNIYPKSHSSLGSGKAGISVQHSLSLFNLSFFKKFCIYLFIF